MVLIPCSKPLPEPFVLGVSHHTGIELNWAIHDASVTRLLYSAEQVSLSMFNGLPHLDRDGKRQLITYR